MTRLLAAACLTAAFLLGGVSARAAETASAPAAASVALPDGAVALPAPGAASVAAAAASGADGVRSSRFRIRPVDDAWRKSLPRDADAATQAYLDRLPADVVASSNAYYEGGYWLILWNYLVGLLVSWLLLAGRTSARVRDWCRRTGRLAFFSDMLYGAFFSIASFVLSLPLSIYQGFVREHQYEMATQTFGPWFGEQLIGLAVATILGSLATAVLYWIIRLARDRWWLWGTVGSICMLTFVVLIQPVFVDPLFNTYTPVSDPTVRAAVLQMAKADGVPLTNVYQFDASRQTTRVSANVSGIFGSAAVRLNDNLLKCTLPEIRSVMGHELGHYVLNHIYKFIAESALVLLAGFLFVKWAMERMLARFGARWGVGGVGDVATLPLLIAVFSTFFLLATPINNTLVRTQEIEADRFGLNLAREPHGEAEVDLKLVEYRKADPGPIEEYVFFDHPSTRFRIHDAMRWREAMGTE
jgi:STE24 endopeptidase